MTYQSRLKKLCNVLKDGHNVIEYRKLLPRLRFQIENIWVSDEPLLCQKMSNEEINYLEVGDLTMEELKSIVLDLENKLLE